MENKDLIYIFPTTTFIYRTSPKTQKFDFGINNIELSIKE